MVFKAISQREALQGHSILYALERHDRLIVEPRYQLTITTKTNKLRLTFVDCIIQVLTRSYTVFTWCIPSAIL